MDNQIKNCKINIIAFLFTILLAAILSILFFNHTEVHQKKYNKYLLLNGRLIYVGEESIPFTGRMFDTLDNKMMVEFDVVNGLKNGEFFLFSPSGKLKAYGFIENNKKVGTWEYYHENGQLESTGGFNNDKPSGKWVWYYENGTKKCEGIYLKGMPEGNWMKYDNEGYPGLVIKFCAGEVLSMVEIQKPKLI